MPKIQYILATGRGLVFLEIIVQCVIVCIFEQDIVGLTFRKTSVVADDVATRLSGKLKTVESYYLVLII